MRREHRGWDPNDPFMPQDMDRFGVGLSEAAPIQAALVVSDAPGEPGFDMHFGVELGVVLSGRMRRIWRGWQTELEPGEVWYCGVWERHGWQVVAAPCEHLVLVLLPQALLDPGLPMVAALDLLAPFRVPPEQRPRPPAVLRQQVLGLAQRIADRLRATDGESTDAGKLWARLLACELLCRLQQGWAPTPPARAGAADSFESLASAVELVFRSRRLVTTEQAARAAGLSASAFSRAFREFTGISFAKFALRHRLSGAAGQLLRTQDTVGAVARQWGFADDSHLHHAFVSHYGVSPNEYRGRRSRVRES